MTCKPIFNAHVASGSVETHLLECSNFIRCQHYNKQTSSLSLRLNLSGTSTGNTDRDNLEEPKSQNCHWSVQPSNSLASLWLLLFTDETQRTKRQGTARGEALSMVGKGGCQESCNSKPPEFTGSQSFKRPCRPGSSATHSKARWYSVVYNTPHTSKYKLSVKKRQKPNTKLSCL